MTWYRHEEYQDMVQTQGISGHGTDTRKIWHRQKEDLDMVWTQGRSIWFTAGHFLHSYCITLNFILSQHYMYVYICILTNMYKKRSNKMFGKSCKIFYWRLHGVILNFFYL
jgi:hypothetical protein